MCFKIYICIYIVKESKGKGIILKNKCLLKPADMLQPNVKVVEQN